MRSDLIGSINQKLSIITRDKKPVIDKQRSEFDKRSFEYFIHPPYMELVDKIIGKKWFDFPDFAILNHNFS